MKMSGFIASLKTGGDPITWDTPAGKDGCSLIRGQLSRDRYCVDFADDFNREGWKQFDTDQDAAYFGVWVNPVKLLTLTYCEGDWTLVECPDVERYNREIQRMIDHYREGEIATVIDRWRMTVYRQDRSSFLIQ